jgi:hypothetical protein
MDQYSLIARIFLGLSIPLSIGLFLFMRPQRAALVIVLGCDMFLPELVDFKFPFMPPLTKQNLPYLCILIGCLLRRRARLLKFPRERWFQILTVMLIVGATLTGVLNGDPIVVKKNLPPVVGLGIKDGLYLAALNLSQVSLPFFLGCALFRTVENFRTLLLGFALAVLCYIPFALFEIRFSPVLHFQFYGYGQHDYFQTLRAGGFRPMAFMANGLALARFLVVGLCASFILGRAKRKIYGLPAYLVGSVIFVTLILCKSMGALAFAFVAIPLLMWGGPKLHLRIALALASFVFLYPVLRTTALLPTDTILNASTAIFGEERAGSLGFRFTNENMLLDKARQRIVFGWGQYGRNFVVDKADNVAVPDGYWVIQIGLVGVFGFITTFGPLLIPIFLTRKRIKLILAPADRRLVGGMTLIIGLIALDWVPNGLFTPYPYLLAGALTGLTRELMSARPEAAYQEEYLAQQQDFLVSS